MCNIRSSWYDKRGPTRRTSCISICTGVCHNTMDAMPGTTRQQHRGVRLWCTSTVYVYKVYNYAVYIYAVYVNSASTLTVRLRQRCVYVNGASTSTVRLRLQCVYVYGTSTSTGHLQYVYTYSTVCRWYVKGNVYGTATTYTSIHGTSKYAMGYATPFCVRMFHNDDNNNNFRVGTRARQQSLASCGEQLMRTTTFTVLRCGLGAVSQVLEPLAPVPQHVSWSYGCVAIRRGGGVAG